MEGTVKEEFSEPSNFFNIKKEDSQQTRSGRDIAVDNFQLLCSPEDDTTDDVDQDIKCCIMSVDGFSNKETFANHLYIEHNDAFTAGCSELWNDEQNHINYYDAFQTIKIEIHENENKAEIKEDIFSIPEDVNCNTVHLKDCSQLKREEIGNNTPSTVKTGINEIFNKSHKEKKKVVMILPSVSRHNGKKPLTCDICDYKTSRKSNLRVHIRTHNGEKLFACNICDYKCSKKNILREHIKRHAAEKQFGCNICDYKCNRSHDLKKHIRTHTGEKPFVCNICDYKCSQNGNLREHIKTHTGEKPFACDICDYRCNRNYHLKRHIRTHTGEKPFACDMCDYKCSLKSNLKEHIRTHTGGKPFACNFCDYKCSLNGNLRKHIITHTGEKPFACKICDYKCNLNSNLRKHIKTHL